MFNHHRSTLPAATAVFLMAAAGLASGCGLAHSATGNVRYYLSPSGNDSAAGTSPATAWRTLARASRTVLRPGDRLLLQGGAHFAGELKLDSADAGNARDPVRVGTYGHGRATIVGHRQSGIVIYNTAGIRISGLNIIGRNALNSRYCGIILYTTRLGQRRLDGVTIKSMDVSGFGTGISIGAAHEAGFEHVSVTHSRVHGNLDAGLETYGPSVNFSGPTVYAHADIKISRVIAFDNLGDPADTTNNSGSGIVLGSVKHAAIVWSVAYHNGGNGGAPRQGPEGIWAYDSTKISIAHDLAYGNTSATNVDGGGFGLDIGTSDSVMQDDMAYGNKGPGFLLYGRQPTAQSGNVVRFDISSGDAWTRGSAGGIQVGGQYQAAVYQNTVVAGAPSRLRHSSLWLGRQLHSVTVRNNIFVADKEDSIVLSIHSINKSHVLLQGNNYFAPASAFPFIWGKTSYASFDAWRSATGQENVRGRHSGFAVNPEFVGPVLGLTRKAASTGAGFALRRDSRMRGAGLALTRLFGINPGSTDFSGKPMSPLTPNVGAQ